MQMVLYMRCCRLNSPIQLKEEVIVLYIAIKYLGLWFDGNVSFNTHTKKSAANAEQVFAAIKAD